MFCYMEKKHYICNVIFDLLSNPFKPLRYERKGNFVEQPTSVIQQPHAESFQHDAELS